jgi:hypothetical protein
MFSFRQYRWGKKNSWDKNNTIMKTATKGLIRNSWLKDIL